MIILFTGGGSAGHIVPNVPLIQRLAARGHRIHYAGSGAPMERELLVPLPLTYHALPTGKLRRYLSWENVRDAYRVIAGVVAGLALVSKVVPDVVFSKGGFVSVPTVMGAALRRVPVIAHESDRSPGLANRIAHRVATVVCTTFPDTTFSVGRARVEQTGLPIRESLLNGSRTRGRDFLRFVDEARPILLIVGGSLGARRLNVMIREHLAHWLQRFQVVHLCGAGNLDATLEGRAGYRQFEFLSAPMGDVVAAADVLISRAGATSMYEWMALRKPALYVPLPLSASRGDQIENAAWAKERNLCEVLPEEALSVEAVDSALTRLLLERESLAGRMAEAFPTRDATDQLCNLIEEVGRSRRRLS